MIVYRFFTTSIVCHQDILLSIVVKYKLIILHPSSSIIICNERDTFRHCLISNLPLHFWIQESLPSNQCVIISHQISFLIFSDCRVCHTWFSGSSHSSKSSDPPTRSRSSSPRWKSQNKDISIDPQINHNSNPTVSTSTSVNYYKNKMKEHHFHVRSKSEKSESYETTWRVCNPKGEKIILLSNSSRKRKDAHSTSCPSMAVEVTTSPALPSPNFNRVLSYFYWTNF